MPSTVVPYSTLANIQTKVRRLTRSPSENQLSDADIDQYINNFVLYDFPQHLRLFDLRTTFTFYTAPFIDYYETNTTDPTSPFYYFNQKYISIHPPVYIAGYQQMYTQSREQFFGIYPIVNSISSIGVAGDGVETHFAGIVQIGGGPYIQPNGYLGTPLLQRNVLFSSVDANGNSLAVHDVPINVSTGNLIGTPGSVGTINYLTGAYDITFATPPGPGVAINSQVVPYVPALPQAILFYCDAFYLRPVPDQAYRVRLECYIRPTEFLSTTPGQSPKIEEWWQYIAYGAAKKVFEDRMDMESVQMIMPEFKKQEALVQRKTILENTNERTATIYTEQNGGLTSGGFGWGSGLI